MWRRSNANDIIPTLGDVLCESKWPKLVSLHLGCMKLDGLRSTEHFFRSHPQLEQLTYVYIGTHFCVASILSHLSNLKALNLRFVGQVRDAECFRLLKKLRSLQLNAFIDAEQTILNELIAGEVQLERLQLHIDRYSNVPLTDLICQITSINWLEIDSIDDGSLSRIIQNLEHLTEIHISSSKLTIGGIRHALDQSTVLRTANIHARRINQTIDTEDINAIDELRKSRPIDLDIHMVVYEHVSLPK